MAGETDLTLMLRSLSVRQRRGAFAVITTLESVGMDDGVEALIREDEGVTVIAAVEAAEHRGWQIDFVAAWLTLEVHSALEAVGLTAVFSTALADAGIPCNVLAGFYHDHLLVPVERAAEAIEVLNQLRNRQGG